MSVRINLKIIVLFGGDEKGGFFRSVDKREGTEKINLIKFQRGSETQLFEILGSFRHFYFFVLQIFSTRH